MTYKRATSVKHTSLQMYVSVTKQIKSYMRSRRSQPFCPLVIAINSVFTMALTAAACFIGIFSIATAAIITIIYAATKRSQKKVAYSSNNYISCKGFEYPYDPQTRSIVESSSLVSNDSNNNLRKRTPKLSSTIAKKSEVSSDHQSNLKVSKEVQNDAITYNTLPRKMPISGNEKVISYLNGDIPASNSDTLENPDLMNSIETLSDSSSSSWSNLSSEKSTDSYKKAYKKKVHKSLRNYVSNMIQENCELHFCSSKSSTAHESDNLSTSSSWSNISSEKSTDDFEKAYRKKVLKKFLKTINKTSKALSECSDESSSSISGDLEICIACQENQINTHTQPCNHRYVCSDCSKLFFRVYNKCKICQARIENFVEE